MLVFHVATLLVAQFAGEMLVRAFGLVIPGPVVGMALLLVALLYSPKLAESLRPTATALLSFLSLLFVPAGVGIVDYSRVVGGDGPALFIALVVSTIAAMIVSALTFKWVAGRMGNAK